MRIAGPELQLMIHNPWNHKICNVKNGPTTNACVNYFDIKKPTLDRFWHKVNTHRTNTLFSTKMKHKSDKMGVKYFNFHPKYLRPTFFGFYPWKRRGRTCKKNDRIRETYGWGSVLDHQGGRKWLTSVRTPHVGVNWKRRNMETEGWNEWETEIGTRRSVTGTKMEALREIDM